MIVWVFGWETKYVNMIQKLYDDKSENDSIDLYTDEDDPLVVYDSNAFGNFD